MWNENEQRELNKGVQTNEHTSNIGTKLRKSESWTCQVVYKSYVTWINGHKLSKSINMNGLALF